MKKLIFAIFGLTFIVIYNSCTKDDVISGDVSEYAVGSYLSYTGDAPSGPLPLDAATINSSTVSISVKTVGTPVETVNIYAGESVDKSTWKLIKTVPFQDSGTLSVTGAELATALGVDPSTLEPGTIFTFYNEVVTTDGKTFSSANTSSDFQAQAAYKMALFWEATVECPDEPPFVQSIFTGNFAVVFDEWNDFLVGELINVTPGPGPNQITITAYPSPNYGINRKPIVIDVDPDNYDGTNGNVATVSKQVYGDYPGFDTNLSVQGSGTVNSCTKTIDLILEHVGDGGDYGSYELILRK